MRLSFLIPMVFLPVTVFAQTSLNAISDSAFQKDLFKKSSVKSIQGGSPVDGQSFTLTGKGKVLGTFIAGKGFNAHDDNVCFVGWSEKKPLIKTVIPTIGFDDWEAEVCNATKSVGIISNDSDTTIKIAVIYEAASPNATADEAVIFSVDSSKNDIEIDKALTGRIGSSGAKTIGELKKHLTEAH
ncbi:hypothetical protein [Erwinia psidii]|uniref:Uncharacterized protein n=1 Tax=Erwinia psidii TaxID=69224 RepID=A0A3N6ULW2_9GAMM|nr:hypothetical protein [Erwinia psidii]MCX8959404.1 hypothetical protein [Erwinia psidii]MCX8962660.1 hypothetical protein [Erwinia psidii]MCX8964256.1 hypothetical protein [Erwinia psidii]RQM36909.1 hypothetical protein EB241_18295 [Erwinia psidii]